MEDYVSVIKYGKDIPTFVRNLRRDLQLSQSELGAQLGVHGQYVSNVERGKMKSYVGFVSLLYTVCPKDRKPYLQDLLSDAAANHAVRRLEARAKAAKKVKGKKKR